jgi:hypothetical protein
LATLRERAKFDLVASAALPVSDEDWLLHLDAHNEEFSRLLRGAVSQRKSALPIASWEKGVCARSLAGSTAIALDIRMWGWFVRIQIG